MSDPDSYHIEVVAWRDYDNETHGGKPSSVDDTYSVKVHYWNDEGDDGQFWAHVGGPFDDWMEWWYYIQGLMGMHGMELA